MNFKVGDEFSESSSNEIIQSLFKLGLFSDITIIKNDSQLDITLIENPIIKYVEFNQDKDYSFYDLFKNTETHFSNDELNELILNNDLTTGNIYTEDKFNNFLLSLESIYFDSGFYNIELTPIFEFDSQNRVAIEIVVVEGKKAIIESFKISGSEKISEDNLLKLFKIGEADFAMINYFTKKNQFDNNLFKSGLENITNAYFNKGFMDFKILNVQTNLDENKEKISIEIQIEEGLQYKLGQVSFSGEIGSLSIEDLDRVINLRKGEVFNRSSIIQSIQSLTDLFADKGYAFVNINPMTYDKLESIDINFVVSLNKKTYINRIEIIGNTRTQDEVIRREIGISEGGIYSRSILRDSLLKLRRLGYFSDVQISTSEVENMPDKINITFTVEETQTGSVSFAVSHSNNFGVSIGAGIEEKNIFGSGNTLNANFNISDSFNKISFYFMNPNYNDQGHSLSFGAFKSELNDDDVAKNSYEINTTGLTLGYGIPLSNSTRINTELEFSQNEVICSSLFSGSGYESSQCSNKNNDEFKARVNWNKNTLDDYLYPTNGINNSLSASISLPLGDYRYFNLDANHISYRPVSDTSTLKLTGNFNLSKGYNGKELPFYRRNFGGGSGSIRGFGNKTLGPTYPNGKAKGGEIAILGSANLITPAFFFDDNEKMRMSVFIDAGNIYEKSSNIKLEDIRMSTGLGFAYLSPIGSIGAFISTPILKKDGDIIEDFGFSLGTGF
jgi:outer membrane protein insertion porin family